ncbi:unnamed protein product [Caenorhabditis angaria]|uniref:Uncharacterized protein n=1 Tax=Caenorhabditis angaria TaxID=860376 RepID=A0A9P1NA38_9PELO|nr:unnamed protein product [Caenorhabditis angaria]
MDRETLIEHEDNARKNGGFFSLAYKYTTRWEKFIIFIGTIFSILTGFATPYMSYCFGIITYSIVKITTALNNNTLTPAEIDEDFKIFQSDMNFVSLNFFLCGICYLVFGSFQASTFHYVGEKFIHRIRNAYIKKILHKDAVFFDKTTTGELSSVLNDNLERLRETVNEKNGLIFQFVTEFLLGFALPFWLNWKLSCYGILFALAVAMSGFINSASMAKLTTKQSYFYNKAGSIALQALSLFKTVISLNGQSIELQNYEKTLKLGEKNGNKRAFYFGLSRSTQYFFVNLLNFVIMYIGTTLMYDGTCDAQTIMQLFNNMLFGSFALAEAFPHISLFISSLSSAKPIIDLLSTDDDEIENRDNPKISNINGKITFENVTFSYPSRPETQVLKNISFDINPGDCIALVGASGSGKSSIIQLLLHYYDVISGKIKLDGHSIEDINLNQLRNIVGVVSQEPILFNTTIEENLRFGKENASLNELYDALKLANAYEFVSKLPNKLKTIVGERGSQLSGGQKQRIAIARTLLRNPTILLLDEATSALDNESEHLVQKSLDKASEGRTTIVVAHRLSTIRNAHKIIVMDKGEIVEVGDHNSLMQIGGVYASLTEAQLMESNDQEDNRFGRQISEKQNEHNLNEGIGCEDQDTDEMERLNKELESENISKSNLFQILRQCKPDIFILILAFIVSAAQSICYPALAQLIAEVNNAYAKQGDELLYYGHFWSLMFIPLGTFRAITLFLQYYLFGKVSEQLSTRLRIKSFAHLMKQPCQFFDDPKHSALKLSIRLNTDASNVKAAVDPRLGSLIMTVSAIFIAIASSVWINWKMTVQMLMLCPFLFIAEYFYTKSHENSTKEDSMCFENSNKTTVEAIENIRTVRSLNIENRMINISISHVQKVISQNLKRSIIQGCACGLSFATFCFVYAIALKFGAWLAIRREIYPIDVYRIIMCLAMTANTAGNALIYVPDYKKAIRAAALIFKLFTYPATMDWQNTTISGNNIEVGDIEANDVCFNYGETTVLNGINFKVTSGKSLALVGSSGCGKSTIISLLERFYHISDGSLKIDKHEIEDIEIQTLRSNIAIVSQEPTLFNLTIEENLLYGLTRAVPKIEIENALKTANAYDFCMNFPIGLETFVGERGAQLSGGQKQRIAIARAILRNPKILLLDEATSALDSESEKVVQEALNNASRQLTTIIVAHRLSTIVNSDSIAVLKDGVITEQGTHSELLRLNGIYTNLVQKSQILSTSSKS